MELNDSTGELRDLNELGATRSGLGIDLNETPSPSFIETLPDSIDIVRTYHENPPPPPGGPVWIPGEGRGAACAVCAKPEVRGHVVVCDGCDRGHHLGCAGMRGRQEFCLDEWLCEECLSTGIKSKRWPLGVKSKQILDINTSPPSDGDDDGNEDLWELRKHTLDGNSFGADLCGAPVTCSKFSNGYVAQAAKLGFEDIINHTSTVDRSLQEADLNFSMGKHRNSNNTAVRRPRRTTSEILLRSLKEFVSDRDGVLEEGWHVDVRQSTNSSDVYAVYCAPNGRLFDSVIEVASYLGLMSNDNYAEPAIRNERSSFKMEGSHISRKRKSARCPVRNGSVERKNASISCYCKESSANGGRMECPNACESTSQVSETGLKDENTSGYQHQQEEDGLPLQFADFFVISMGKIDARPSYNDVNIIWPVGYKSCWHDKITGSIFTCEVLDGGDSGPLFKVKRCSCSGTPVPVGSTILSLAKPTELVRETNEEDKIRSYDNWDGDSTIQMIFSDPCLPMDNDIFSCLTNPSNKASDSQLQELLLPTMVQNQAVISIHIEREQTDEIGEISAEECSSSLAWNLLSKKFVDVCSEIYKQKGTLKFFCKHAESEKCHLKWDMENANSMSNSLSASFAKFYGSPGFASIPSIVQVDHELNVMVEAVSKWLDQDRFGLDMAFVQEILEQHMGAQDCKYQFLNTRNDYITSWTVSNGFLVMEATDQLQYNEEGASNGLCDRLKRARLAEEPTICTRCPPQGKPVCSRVPSELVGDVFQAWELLCRFQDTLDLKESISLVDLEEELMSPWFDGLKSWGKFEKKTQGHQISSVQGVDRGGETIFSVSSESESKVSKGNPHVFIPMETEAMKEEVQVKLASSTYSRCYGVALTKAHIALLGVLISELQTKVAALVDPNFELGESRPKRGRKKDIDPSISSKRSKLNILPVNELTWPELARRYVLAVLSMDGNLDSAEITARESGKVFRCLQGDGGLLCGSLTGIAGMEADALLLAEASKHIFGSITKESEILTIKGEGSEVTSASEKDLVNNGDIPEWAKSLEPVRKLPTNVGTRIRKCIYDALDKNPPEWARKVLEHSISKEVYKGNASGPTKKAVLSVLSIVWHDGSEQKPAKATKKKIVISVSDIIMKQCRIILRRAAAVDDAKVFCNLLGRKLINSCDNDDEGLLGSPAMVSRPLDFRTIDLRLATGAYGGSHEAFLEDVRELWHNLRIAYGDHSDLAELADKLSANFESLYANEVVRYVQKFMDYPKAECLSEEMRKELDELTASLSEVPKAPWDDGVCKVCGVDKDDDSVLLCDTCDAEYHTYCLNPPLVRIPEGNWYCPSCVVSKHMAQDVSGLQQVPQRQANKFREVTSVYKEALAHISAVMEEKEYWEYSPSERAFLLNFLSDELLNSTLIRQHLDQCAELSADLNQKLRSFYFEWKTLKIKEDIISAKAARMDSFPMSVAGNVGVKEGFSTSMTHSSKSLVQQHSLSDKSNHFVVLPESHASQEAGKEKSTSNSGDSAKVVTKETDGRHTNPSFVGGQMIDVSAPSDANKRSPNLTSTGTDAPNKSSQSSLSNDFGSLGPRNESCSYQLELNAIKNDISLLRDSIMTVESQLFKLSFRREFLGIDSIGQLYWASAIPGGCPCIIVDATAAMMHGGKSLNHNDHGSKFPFLRNCAPFKGTFSSLVVPKVGTSCGRSNALSLSSLRISYHTDADVDLLVDWLRYNDPKGRELRESIIHWKKVKSQGASHTRSQALMEQHVGSSMPINIENVNDSCLVAKATTFLEKKYGICIEFDPIDISKKLGRKAKETNEEKPYRCECLELIWPSRQHCLYCHRTFLSNMELEGHNEGNCSVVPSTSEKSKDVNELSKGIKIKKSEAIRNGYRSDADTVTTSKKGSPKLAPGLIIFQNEDQLCPHNYEDIYSKFVTNDSNRELIKEIGLIGSDGVPSFVPSVAPFVSNSALMLMTSQEDGGVTGEWSKASDGKIPQGKINVPSSCGKEIAEKTSADEINKSTESTKPTCQTRDLGDGHCCVVPLSSLRPLVGKVSHISRQLKINLLDMDAALPDDALRPSKAQLERRWAWRAFVKSAGTIFEMVQATIILEDMIKTEYLRNDWWYWSSLSAAAKTSTLSSLALRIYSLDAAILYQKSISTSSRTVSSEAANICEQKTSASVDVTEKSKASIKSSRKRKEPDG